MPQIRYRIPMLSAQAIITYANDTGNEIYSYNLNRAETAATIMRGGNTLQDENAIFFQAMCVVKGEEYRQPTENTIISDLADVMLYLDFSGIFNRDVAWKKNADRQKKAESMFRPEGITLDLGSGSHRYLAFERSGNMSRHSKLSFVRADVYDKLRERMMLGMKIGMCQLSKLYAYNGLMFSDGVRIESESFYDSDSIIVIDNPKETFYDVNVVTVEDTTKTGEVRKYERVENKTDIEVTMFDGEGLISPDFAREIDTLYCGEHSHTSFQIRLPYIKGMVHTLGFEMLLRDAAVYEIKDMWGVSHPVCKIKMILTKSQYKGCGWMTENGLSFAEYLTRCRTYRHALYITGVNDPKPDSLTALNYQFLSTLSLDADKFRPMDKPLGWETDPADDPDKWLTKHTEKRYYQLIHDDFARFDFIVDHAGNNPNAKKYVLAELLRRNDLLINEKVFTDIIDNELENIINQYATGNILVPGGTRYLSGDLTILMMYMLEPYINNNLNTEDIYNELLDARPYDRTVAYSSGISGDDKHRLVILRNPHISRNEEVVVGRPTTRDHIRHQYFSHLYGVVMVEPHSLIAERLGGADYDGDIVKLIGDPIICDCIAGNYTENPYQRYDNDSNLPLLQIPTAEPQIRDANDWYARFLTVRNTFSSRVGQISNAALNRSLIAYDKNADPELREQCRREAETLAILTGLEIDSAKSGIKPDLTDYLGNNTLERSRFLKYKRLLDKSEERRKDYETKHAEQFEEFFGNADWSAVSSHVERLPYLAYMLKKNTPRPKRTPAKASDLFFFAVHPNWQDSLDPEILKKVAELIETYNRALNRVRVNLHPKDNKAKKKDIDRILFMRNQENDIDSDVLYTLFVGVNPERISEIRKALKERKWHLLPEDRRTAFLLEYLPEPEYAEYYDLFSDFRQGGYRILGDLICDADEENRRNELSRLHFDSDSEVMTALMNAYEAAQPTPDYREAVADACRWELHKIVPLNMAFRYVVALDKRSFLWDVLWREAGYFIKD